jgi:hypothetical protein
MQHSLLLPHELLHLSLHFPSFQALGKPCRLHCCLCGRFLADDHHGAGVLDSIDWRRFVLQSVGGGVVFGGRVATRVLVSNLLPVGLRDDGRKIGAGVADSRGLDRPIAVDLRG